MNLAIRFASAAAALALLTPTAFAATTLIGKPMRAVAIVVDTPDSISGICRAAIRRELIMHGFRVVAPARADVILNLYGSEDEPLRVKLADTYVDLRNYEAEVAAGRRSTSDEDHHATDVADEIEDFLDDHQMSEVTYEYRLTLTRNGEQLAYGGKHEKSGGLDAVCSDIADDIGDTMQKELSQTVIVHRLPERDMSRDGNNGY